MFGHINSKYSIYNTVRYNVLFLQCVMHSLVVAMHFMISVLSHTYRASVFPFQKCVNSVSGFANSVFYRFRFAKFRFLPFQIFKIPFYFFQAVFLL